MKDKDPDTCRQQMATTWPVSMATRDGNRKSALEKFSHDYLGDVVPQWPLQPTREHIQEYAVSDKWRSNNFSVRCSEYCRCQKITVAVRVIIVFTKCISL